LISLGKRLMSWGESAGSVGSTDFRAFISERRSFEASRREKAEVQSGQRQVKPRFARRDLIRRPEERFS
jgi:hypothetical protein